MHGHESPTVPAWRSALSTLAAIVVAPGEAFAELRERPVWLWALLATIAARRSRQPARHTRRAARHRDQPPGTARERSAFGRSSTRPSQSAHRHGRRNAAKFFAQFNWLITCIYIPITIGIEAGILFLVRSMARKRTGFSTLYALTAHVQFISIGLGIAQAVQQVSIVAMRPLDSLRTQADLVQSIPSLAWLVPNAPTWLASLLGLLNPFSIWATIVLALGLVAVVDLRRWQAWLTSLGILFAAAGIVAAFVH